MTTDELLQLMTLSGYKSRIKKDQVILEECTFCGNKKWNLDLHPGKGVYRCWVCRATGKLEDLLQQLTGQAHHIRVNLDRERRAAEPAPQPGAFRMVPAAQVGSALAYLEKRGLTPRDAVNYGLQVCVEPKHPLSGRLLIPANDYWTGELLGWSARSYIGGHPKYLSTMTVSAVTGWRRKEKHLPVVLVEGHMDGIAVHRAGYHAAVLGGVYAVDVELWAARVPPGVPIIIMLDPEAANEARRLYWSLVAVRGPDVLVARLEGGDPASLGPAGVQAVVDTIRT